jgi:hypothetical protein
MRKREVNEMVHRAISLEGKGLMSAFLVLIRKRTTSNALIVTGIHDVPNTLD